MLTQTVLGKNNNVSVVKLCDCLESLRSRCIYRCATETDLDFRLLSSIVSPCCLDVRLNVNRLENNACRLVQLIRRPSIIMLFHLRGVLIRAELSHRS